MNQARVIEIEWYRHSYMTTHEPFMDGDEYWYDHMHHNASYACGHIAPRYPVPAIPTEFMWFPEDEFGPALVSYIRDYKFGWDMGGWRQEILY